MKSVKQKCDTVYLGILDRVIRQVHIEEMKAELRTIGYESQSVA